MCLWQGSKKCGTGPYSLGYNYFRINLNYELMNLNLHGTSFETSQFDFYPTMAGKT
jgi:hypothetical protein